MSTLTYCKGLPTPIEEINPIGFTELEMLLTSFSQISHSATCETVNHLLMATEKFNKSKWNTHLQSNYQINKRQAGGVIAASQGKVDSAKECRKNHVKQLQAKLKSAQEWISKSIKKLKLAEKFYAKKDWINSKTGCNFPLESSLLARSTNWQHEWFRVHQKQRYIHTLINRIKHLKTATIRVKVPHGEVFIVGSKDESFGNQACQWNGNILTIREIGRAHV